ncbi:hypothetical protein [Cytobacillus sp. IB215316]|uniref:tetratricopeptide repeat protein n=1 Tax=Cytobacillus sp. IB215316 TaxID=3097354 RepID=UPI002A0B07A9|nr:hypothetical protein [Cytobacillus sp. IB215316]MDX8360675.1 hypothetical protein [Cytobacillus sp. IB215316]
MENDNAFLSAILHLKEVDNISSLWTQGVCRTIEHEIPFHLGQVLEPSTLVEVSRVTQLPLEKILKLDYETSGFMRDIKDNISNMSSLSSIEKLILSYRLTYIARYDLAISIFSSINIDDLVVQNKIQYYFLKFILQNRQNQNQHEKEFTKMMELFEVHTLPESQILMVCSNAIVWKLKAKSIGEKLFNWFVEYGLKTAESLGEGRDFKEHIALSQFYRAYAMIPAEDLLINETRKEMEKSLYFANLAVPKNSWQEYRKSDAIKTIYESELKEHLYVSKNLQAAEKAGRNLLSLDPNWSISYHEVAEVFLASNQVEKALEMFEKSLHVGLPRLIFTQYMIGHCLGTLKREEEAIDAFVKTLKLDTYNISAGINGYNFAKKLNHHTEGIFKSFLDKWEEKGVLEAKHKEFINV